jgi:dipeptidyl aminopeptidase/acylaminoacyl peptidase
MWLWVGLAVLLVVCFGIAGWVMSGRTSPLTLTPLSNIPLKEKPLEKYTIENLAKRTYTPSPIVFEEPIATTSTYTVLPFYFTSDGQRVTGLSHVPNIPLSEKLPVIVQFRGFADREAYEPGLGTKHSAEVFAQNGFVSLAPDFLGYGGSDKGPENVFEDRFETYTTALNLLASIPTISFVDPAHVCIWGHSNGGQIALTVLTILGEKGSTYPTSLWAPVTKIFPYSILYYTDEFEDYGKALRKELAAFEKDYDTDQFAFFNYLDRIQAPIIFHQGTADEAVPLKWSDDSVKLMKEKGKTIRYYTYQNADHNLTIGWNTVVSRDIEFFRSFLR